MSKVGPARIEQLKVTNYRALSSIELKDITPLTVLLGPNGSGKSTLFDVFNFLPECFQFGLRYAWDRRGRARELKTRGQTGPVIWLLTKDSGDWLSPRGGGVGREENRSDFWITEKEKVEQLAAK